MAFYPVQGKDYSLSGAGVSATATSIVVSSLTLPNSNALVTMAMFGVIGYGVFEPGTGNEENFSFTALTQNANGTATLSGVTRGLRFDQPFTQDTTLRTAHTGGTILRFSNTVQLFSEYATKRNDETISGVYDFTVSPTVPTPSTSSQAASKGYVDGVAVAGAPDASTTVKGVSRISASPTTTIGTATITIASPAVVSFTAHGLTLNDTVQFTTTGALPTGITASTNYYVISTGLTANAFEISATLGGTAINTSGSQSGTHTLYKTTPVAVGDNDPRLPTQGENDALVGNNTDIAVGTSNKFVTQTGLIHNSETFAVDGSASSTAYTATLSPVVTSLTNGMTVRVKIGSANTTTTPTLNVNSLGAKTIVKGVTTALAVGDIAASMYCTFVYDSTNTVWVLQNPVATVPTTTPVPYQQLPFYTGTSTGLITNLQSNTSGSVFFNAYNNNGGSNVVIQRIISDAKTGQMYITHTATWTLTTGVVDSIQMGVTSSYLYIWCSDNGTMKMNRYDVANLSNATSMTISGATGTLSVTGAGFSDGTNLYAYKNTVATLQKYTISGTTATYSSDISYTSADFSSGGITCDGTYVYNSQATTSAVAINKYALAGGAIVSTTNIILNMDTYPNSSFTSTSLHIRTSQVLGISYAHSITSATALVGYVQEVTAITLP